MIIGKIAREAEHARAGKPARIIAKMNALMEPQVIQALYRASRAGVKIDLIVRGVCACAPASPGSRRTSRVRSIVGRFLEHTRVFCFDNSGEPELYCASADWMERNFFRRVEVGFPILRRNHIERILRDLDLCLRDNCQAWRLKPDGQYERIARGEARAAERAVGAPVDLRGRAVPRSPDQRRSRSSEEPRYRYSAETPCSDCP